MGTFFLHWTLFSPVPGWTALWAAARRGTERREAPGPAADDSQAVEGFLETRDGRWFEVLVERYKDRVFRLVLSVLGFGKEAEAEEVTQDVFLKVFRQLSAFRAESRFSTWLYRIAYRQAVDRKRQAGFSKPHLDLSALADEPLLQPDPLAQAENRERSRAVQACLEKLPDLYRSALFLHYWMGHSVEEIGELLGAPEGTVKSYLHRGRRLLLGELQKRGLDHGQFLR